MAVMTSDVPQGSVLGSFLFSVFTTPVGIVINFFGINYHLFANNTQLYTGIDPDSPHCLASLASCADAVTGWHIRNDLLLNPSKTKALVASTRQQVAKLDTSNGIAMFSSIMPFSSKQRVFVVTLNEKLTLNDHISEIVRACNYHLCILRDICPFVDQYTVNTIVCSLVCMRLNY